MKSYCDRQTLDKEKESSNILASFGDELQVQRQRQRENYGEQESQIGSQIQNNIVANVNHSPTLNFLRDAEFNNCNITFNVTKK